MEKETLRSRVVSLLQRSRQAHRLYSSMERVQRGEGAEFAENQAAEWRTINAELMKQLTSLLDAPQNRELSSSLCLLKDRFVGELRQAETQLHTNQRELVSASENGDFIKAAILSRTLVSLKARVQATQAVHHELESIVGTNSVSINSKARTLVSESATKSESSESQPNDKVASIFQTRNGKVIPLRARS